MLFAAALGSKGKGFDQYSQGQNKHFWVGFTQRKMAGIGEYSFGGVGGSVGGWGEGELEINLNKQFSK